MNEVPRKVYKLDDTYLVYDVATKQYLPFDSRWTFNGDYDKPTFNPSMRCKYGGSANNAITHCFVTNGQIQYLSDCTHSMAGKTVDCVSFIYGEEIDEK